MAAMDLGEVSRLIECKGCGASGKASWRTHGLREGLHATGLPLSISSGFYFHASAAGTRIACRRCQQFLHVGLT